EAVWVGKDRLVAVGGGVQQQHLVAAVDGLPVQLDVARRGAVHVLNRRHPAQHLFDGAGEGLGGGGQGAELVGVAQQRVHAAADHVAGRFVAADEDEQRFLQQRVVIQARAVDAGVEG